jgi:hypothetical protein
MNKRNIRPRPIPKITPPKVELTVFEHIKLIYLKILILIAKLVSKKGKHGA